MFVFHKKITKSSQSDLNLAINVVWKQQAIPKWLQSLKWSTSAYKKVTKRPSWNLKVVPKWSPSSQQMIQKWSPSNHQITKRSPSNNQMVHRLCQSDHEMVTKWSNFNFFKALDVGHFLFQQCSNHSLKKMSPFFSYFPRKFVFAIYSKLCTMLLTCQKLWIFW